MSANSHTGILAALGIVVLLAAGLLAVWSYLSVEPPPPISVVADETKAVADADADDEPEPAARSPEFDRTGGGRVIDPALDDTEYFHVSYEKLSEALAKHDFVRLRQLVTMAGGQVDLRLAEDLIALLDSKTYGFNASTVLGLVKSPGTVELIYDYLVRTDSAIGRRTAVQALATSGGEEAVPRLVQLLESGGSPDLVAMTASALGLIGSEEAVGGILAALTSRRWPDLDSNLEGALAKARGPEAVALVGRALAEATDPALMRSLVQALGKGGSPAAVAPLAAFVRTADDVDLRAQGVSALGAVGNSEAVGIVLGLAKEDGPLQNVARHALTNVRDKGSLPELVKTLDETTDPRFERSLLVAIGGIGDRSATPRLLEALATSTSVDTKIAAVQALGAMKDPGASSALGEALRSDAHINLRVQAARALETIGDTANIEILKAALEDDPPATLKAVINYSINRLRMKLPVEPRER